MVAAKQRGEDRACHERGVEEQRVREAQTNYTMQFQPQTRRWNSSKAKYRRGSASCPIRNPDKEDIGHWFGKRGRSKRGRYPQPSSNDDFPRACSMPEGWLRHPSQTAGSAAKSQTTAGAGLQKYAASFILRCFDILGQPNRFTKERLWRKKRLQLPCSD